MKLFISKYLLLLLALFLAGNVAAQGDIEKATTLMQRVKHAYDSVNMSFHLTYSYATADKPSVVTDSLSGDAHIFGGNSYMTLGNVILLKNKQYNITVFKDDKLIMLGKPSQLTQDAQLPADAIISALKNAGLTNCQLRNVKGKVTIQMDYSDFAPYKSLEMTIDEPSLRILSMSVKVKKPADPDAIAPPEADTYVIVKTVFTGFKNETGNSNAFDEKIFFTRNGETFKPSPAYADYQVFLASPNI
ncbi:hypothetical protein ACE38W_10090 [Chitinophaga sp. Hz27]|uniref:hypothetical protein n=1 Tax=Chitinophaga sp. Hz27 TaxID=3347169 RepID=UPI0035DFBA84